MQKQRTSARIEAFRTVAIASDCLFGFSRAIVSAMKKEYMIFGGIILLVLAVISGISYRESNTPGKLDSVAQCLKEKGAIFYGAFWSPHCQNQMKTFGRSAKLLPYVECSTPNGQGQLPVCTDKKIEGYPTWEFSDGNREGGEVLLATLGSLTYSEVLGYAPCKLCWIQRIFMYPQVLILGLALFGKHKGSRALVDTSLVLSAIGAVVALYHYLMQLGIIPEGSCAAIGYSVSCAERFVLQFGYITIPLMAFSAYLLVTFALLLKRKE